VNEEKAFAQYFRCSTSTWRLHFQFHPILIGLKYFPASLISIELRNLSQLQHFDLPIILIPYFHDRIHSVLSRPFFIDFQYLNPNEPAFLLKVSNQ